MTDYSQVPLIAIIIVNWNGKDLLDTCLTSLKKTDYPKYNVIVVDNGSNDGSVEFVKKKFPEVDALLLDKNYGFAKGNNAGIKNALKKYNPDYILLLNNDVEIVQRDWLKRLIEVSENNGKIGITGCKLVSADRQVQYLGTRITPFGFPGILLLKKHVPGGPFEVDGIIGAVFLIKKEVIEKIGLLDEGFSPFLCEDVDYCIRARKSGYKIEVLPEVEVIHYQNQSMKREPSAYISYIAKKNTLRFVFIHFSSLWIVQRILYDFFCAITVSIFERIDKEKTAFPTNIRVKQIWKSNLTVFVRAYFDNLKNVKEIAGRRIRSTEKLW